MQPAATTCAPESAAPSSSSIDSCLAAWMKPHVLTSTTSASPPSPSVRFQPPASSLAASSSESTSFRAQPSVTIRTVRLVGGAESVDDTPADYGKQGPGQTQEARSHARSGP